MYALPKKKSLTGKADSQDEKPDKKNVENVEGCQTLSFLFQKPTYGVLICVRLNVRMKSWLASLLDKGEDLNLINSLPLPQNWQADIELVEALSLNAANREAAAVQGLTFLQICIGDLPAWAWFLNYEDLAVDLIVGTSLLTGATVEFSKPKKRWYQYATVQGHYSCFLASPKIGSPFEEHI